METRNIKILLQQYFNGESTRLQERTLEEYFSSGKVADELMEYKEFFGGISELSQLPDENGFQDEIMDYILEQEFSEKNKYRSLWRTVTGIAASIIIILGSFLVYEQQQKPFEDTYSNPEEAYLQAEKTLQYISGKYKVGLSRLSKTKKYNEAFAELRKVEIINHASKPLSESLKKINKGFNETKIINKVN